MQKALRAIFVVSLLVSGMTGAVVLWRGAPQDTLSAHRAAHQRAQAHVAGELGPRLEFLAEHSTTQTSPGRYTVSGLFYDSEGARGLQRYTVTMLHSDLLPWRAQSLAIAPVE